MKKTILIVLMSVLCAGFANAQIYLGGSMGVGFGNTKPEHGSKTKNSSFSLMPDVGYSLNAKFEVGATLGFSASKTETNGNDVKNNRWGVAPYARYSVLQLGNFSVWGEGSVFLAGGKQGAQKFTSVGLNVQPVLKYNLSDHFVLSTTLNFLNLGLSHTNRKDVDKVTNFGLGIDSGNVANSGNIAIGFVYKF